MYFKRSLKQYKGLIRHFIPKKRIDIYTLEDSFGIGLGYTTSSP